MCLSSVPGHRCPGKLVPEGVLPPPPPPPMLAASFSPAPGHTCAHPGTRGEMWPDPMVPWYQALPQPHYTQFGGRLRKRKLRPGRDVGCPPVPHMEAPLSPACGTRRPALKFPGSGQTGWRSPAAGQCWVPWVSGAPSAGLPLRGVDSGLWPPPFSGAQRAGQGGLSRPRPCQ